MLTIENFERLKRMRDGREAHDQLFINNLTLQSLNFAERVLILQSQGAKMLPPDIKTKNVDMRRLYMTMHTAAPDLLAEEVG